MSTESFFGQRNKNNDNEGRRTSNPALNKNTFTDLQALAGSEPMTIQGVVNKSGFLITLLIVSAVYIWAQYFNYGFLDSNILPVAAVCLPIGFITAIVTVFKKQWAMYTAPVYAVMEGVILGVISCMFEEKYHGIVIQAVGLTFGTFIALLAAYSTRLIKATENFKLGVTAATGGIAIFYFIGMLAGFFGYQVPLIHEGGIYGIGFSVFVVIIAALNLVLDFDFIEQGVRQHAPKYMEWYCSFGLLVTLVWLYLEILRLLGKSRSK